MFNQEFIDRIEEIRKGGDNTFEYMLSVVRGDEDTLEKESARKKAIADEIMKEKSKIVYGEGTFAELLRMGDSKSKITEEELETVMTTIEDNFKGKEFQSKDLLPLLPKDAEGNPFLNNRKLPSRLKKLSEFNRLVDCGGRPKKYKLAD